ncbi:MAG TPA: hypothetical protein VET25_13345, partial [Aestuariivirgaceae bacterium]|nr:hypothetical protein [Aestuariivirgaceae bacterium]
RATWAAQPEATKLQDALEITGAERSVHAWFRNITLMRRTHGERHALVNEQNCVLHISLDCESTSHA